MVYLVLVWLVSWWHSCCFLAGLMRKESSSNNQTFHDKKLTISCIALIPSNKISLSLSVLFDLTLAFILFLINRMLRFSKMIHWPVRRIENIHSHHHLIIIIWLCLSGNLLKWWLFSGPVLKPSWEYPWWHRIPLQHASYFFLIRHKYHSIITTIILTWYQNKHLSS